MYRIIKLIPFLTITLFLTFNTSFAESNNDGTYINTIGNVSFSANVYGTEITSAPILHVRLKEYDPSMDQTVISLFDNTINPKGLSLQMTDEQSTDDRIISRSYGTTEDIEHECDRYFFYDGTIGAATYESDWYYGLMDIKAMMSYDGACYIEDRKICGDLPMKTSSQVADEMTEIVNNLGLQTEQEPYILRAYSMNDELTIQSGIHAYMQMIVQGNDLLEENRKIVSENGSDCYFIAYRYQFNQIPVSYSYYYNESQDFSTITSHIEALFNDTGLIRFFSINQFAVISETESQELISVDDAVSVAAEELNHLLGVEAFVCKEISLEYVPLAYSGCDPEKEAELTPVWVFYFGDISITPILINAITGNVTA